ncbi:MAG: cytochrome c oxidase assembly protein [Nitriliruptoraceae bacterium]|nr:cytochrome c oxidase assembly protein [Nitriliruptoraceae bacterium]
MNVAFWCSSEPGQIWTWRYTPFLGVWAVAGALIGAYVLAHRRAGRVLDPAMFRRWCFGVLALFAVSEWPLGQLGVGYFATIGILRYVVYTFVAAPLLLSGLPGWLLDRWFPLDSTRGRALSALTSWPAALIIFNVVLFGTHVPITVDTLKVWQLGSFFVDVLHLGAALIWWFPAIRRERARGAIQEPIRAFYLFASSVLMFVPAAFLTFSPLPLYGLYELAPPLWLGFDPISDQQAAGIMMNVVGGFVLWGIIAALFIRWAKENEHADTVAKRERDARTLARMAAMAPASADAPASGDAAGGPVAAAGGAAPGDPDDPASA